MALRGSSGSRFKLKLSRPMLIVLGVLALLLIGVVALILIPPLLRPAAPAPTPIAKVVSSPTAVATPPATEAAPAAGPTLTPLPTVPRPAATVTPVPTFAPAPTGVGVVTGATPTAGVGGGELPGGASGLGWEVLLLIPAGLLLLAVAAWWRWRRAHTVAR